MENGMGILKALLKVVMGDSEKEGEHRNDVHMRSDVAEPAKEPELVPQDVPAIEKQVLLDEAGIKVVARQYVAATKEEVGDCLDIHMENTSDKGVCVIASDICVNHMLLEDTYKTVGLTVSAESIGDQMLPLRTSVMKKMGIKNIGEIEWEYQVVDIDTREIFLKKDVCIQTSKYAQMDTALNKGVEIYNENGVIISGMIADAEVYGETGVIITIENHTDHEISAGCMSRYGSVGNTLKPDYTYSQIMKCSQIREKNGDIGFLRISVTNKETEENTTVTLEQVQFA